MMAATEPVLVWSIGIGTAGKNAGRCIVEAILLVECLETESAHVTYVQRMGICSPLLVFAQLFRESCH